MFNILKRELLSYFKTPLLYFVTIIYMLLSMSVTIFLGHYLDIDNSSLISFFMFQPQILAFIIPGLTMRLWAEEKKNGTIELLLTQPIGYNQIILAKYFAAFIAGMLLLFSTFLFWGYTAILIPLDNPAIVCGYLACALTIAVFTAVGCVVSSLNKNVITAYVITLFLCWIIPYINFDFLIHGYILSPVWIKIVQSLDFYKHYQDMISGQLGLDNIIYYITLVCLLLWVNRVVIETKVVSHHYKKSLGIMVYISMLLVIFVFANITSAVLFSGHRLDLTIDKKYTISEASQTIIQKLQDPLNITLYISPDINQSYPKLGVYAQYVIRQLNRYSDLSNGKIILEIRSPQPFSEMENEAINQGLKPLLSKSGKNNLYFGAVFSTPQGDKKVIPLFIEERQAYLEYDLTRLINKFIQKDKRQVGILASPKIKDQYIYRYLANEYELSFISPDTVEIPVTIRSLIVVNPREISELLVYAIDQFVLRGGGLILLPDPYSENDAPLNSVLGYDDQSFAQYLTHLGVEYSNEFIVGDAFLAEERTIDNTVQKYYPWFGVYREFFPNNTPLLTNISKIALRSPGRIHTTSQDQMLFTTSADSGLMPTVAVSMGEQGLINSFVPVQEKISLAVALEGSFQSQFSHNPITNTKVASLMVPFLSDSLNPTSIIIIGDSDFIFDSAWIKPYSTNDNEIYGVAYQNNNGEFFVRSIDYLNKDMDLVDLSSKYTPAQETTIEESINNDLYIKYYNDYNQTAQKLFEVESQVNQLKHELESKNEKLSLSYMKSISEKEDEYAILNKQLQYLDYKMLQEREHKINMVIIWNMLVSPLIIFILMLLIAFNINLANRRKAQELLA